MVHKRVTISVVSGVHWNQAGCQWEVETEPQPPNSAFCSFLPPFNDMEATAVKFHDTEFLAEFLGSVYLGAVIRSSLLGERQGLSTHPSSSSFQKEKVQGLLSKRGVKEHFYSQFISMPPFCQKGPQDGSQRVLMLIFVSCFEFAFRTKVTNKFN